MQTVKTETSTRIPAPKRTSSFTCSLLGYLLDILPFIGLILSIIGTVLAANGKKEVKRNAQKYSGTERLTAGLVLGIIGIVNSFIILILELVYEESIIEMLSEL